MGGVFGSISCSCSTFIHYQSLTRSLTSFKTMYIVYSRGGGGRGGKVGVDPSPAPAPHLYITSH